MILISQDKTEILNFDRITEIVAYENKICVTDSIKAKKGFIIAQYKSEERAKEVLEKIIEAISPKKPTNLTELANYRPLQKYELPED